MKRLYRKVQKADFSGKLKSSFHSSFHLVDFKKSEEAAKKINHWVEQKTKNKIKDLIPAKFLNKLTRVVLVNAIYFRSNWEKVFDKVETKNFFLSTSKHVKADMMHKTDTVYHANIGTLASRMIELPYKGGEISMQVLLPNKKNGLEELEDKLKDENIDELFNKESVQTNLAIQLPRFKLESTLPLKEVLSDLGLTEMFSKTDANFSGISDTTKLFVSYVIQKAFIEVDEKGAEAAAASGAVAILFESEGPPVTQGKPFVANHPFIIYLRHKKSGMLLFQGRVINPVK